MKLHELKSESENFQAVWSSRRTFEIRLDDRGYQVSDVLHLREIDKNGEHTGRGALVLVLEMMRGPRYGLAVGWVIMSLKLLNRIAPSGPTAEKVGP